MQPSIRHFPLSVFLLAVSALGQDNEAQVVVLGDLNLMELRTGAAGSGVVSPSGAMYFAGKTSEQGTETWALFPWSVGASLLADIRPGPESSNPSQFTVMGDEVIWVADDGVHGPEIRGSQALPPGSPLLDLQPGADHPEPTILGSSEGWAWFTTSAWNNSGRKVTKLWAMNGFNTLQMAAEFDHGSVIQPTAVRGRPMLLLVACQPGSQMRQLCRVTNSSCVVVGNVDTAVAGAVPDAPLYATTTSFVCYRQVSGGYELRLLDLNSGAVSTLPVQSGSTLLPWFATNGTDRVCYAASTAAAGAELWTTWREGNGPVQTALLADVYAGTTSSVPSRLVMSPGNPGVFFQVNEGLGRDLWFVDPLEKPSVVPHKVKIAVHASAQAVMLGEREIALLTPGTHSDQLWLGGHGDVQTFDLTLPKVVRLWNPAIDVPQHKDLCVHTREAGSTEVLLRLSPTAQPWDEFYPFQTVLSSSLVLTNFFGSGTLYFTAGDPGEEWQTLLQSTWGSAAQAVHMSAGSSSSLRPSSMPADFTELDGALLFTAGIGAHRSLYASPDGQQQSAAWVQGVNRPEQLTAFQGRVFLLGYHSDNGTGLKRVYEARKNGQGITASFYDSTPHLATQLAVAGINLYFSEPSGTSNDLLQCMLQDRTLAAPLTFSRDADGTGITQMTAVGTRLFFTAPADSTPNAPRVMWSTDGTAAGTFTPSPLLSSPQILGAAGNACVFLTWSATGEDFRIYFWDGTAAGALSNVPGPARDAPEPNSVAGRPAGVFLDGRFYFTTPAGRVMSASETQMELVYANSNVVVRPDSLAVLGGKLLFLQVGSSGDGALVAFSEATGLEFLKSFPPGVSSCPLHLCNGSAYFTVSQAGNPVATALWQTDGTAAGTVRARQDITLRRTSRLAMGNYRNHLVLAGEDTHSPNGLEPALLNFAPVIPTPPLLTGFQRGQPVAFTYAQIVTGPPTDAEGDLLSPLWLEAQEGTLERNGSPVGSGSTSIEPGDTFVWNPPPSLSGTVAGLQLTMSDSWSLSKVPVQMRIDSPLDTWTRGYFTEPELEDPMLSAPDADADGDGVANALEFVFGRHPRTYTPEPPCTPSVAEAQGGGRVVRFTFVRAAALTEGTALVVETSPDLMPGSWQPVATKNQSAPWTGSATVTETTLPDTRVQVVVELPAPATGQAFMRLSVGL